MTLLETVSSSWIEPLPAALPWMLLGLIAIHWTIRNIWFIRYQLRLWLECLFHRIPDLDVPFPSIPSSSDSPLSSSSLEMSENNNNNHGKATAMIASLGIGTQPSVQSPTLLDPTRHGYIQCWNPSTGDYLGQVPAMTREQVNQVVYEASVAQQTWQRTTFAQRRRVLRTLQKFIVQHQHDLCDASRLDSGKPHVDAILGEVLTTCEKIACLLREGEVWLQPSVRSTSVLTLHKWARVEYAPLGVIATIAPWNYPFHNMINHILSGIFAGNAVVGKVSEHTSWSSYYYFAPIIRAALTVHGHDPNLCPLVTGLGEAGEALCQSPLVDKVIFTGSPDIGRKVMATAAKSLKPVILELGGKDAFVIMDDADLTHVVPFAMRGVFQNGGQNCVGIERILVYESIHDEFVDAVHQRIQTLRTGVPLSLSSSSSSSSSSSCMVDCGALVMQEQLRKIQDLVDDAVLEGAKVLCGGSLSTTGIHSHSNRGGGGGGGGQFYPPTLLVGVTPKMKIFHTEVFGPVMTVIKVPKDNDDACIELANATLFGLGGSVYSNHPQRALAVGRRMRSGMVCVNDFGSNYLVQSLPFGGVHESGFGRFAGIEGLRAVCLERSIVTDRIPGVKTHIPALLDYPIQQGSFAFASSLIHFLYDESWMGKIKGILGLIKSG